MNTDNIYDDYFAYTPQKDLAGFTNLPTETWQKMGEQKALENFQLAAHSVPAYKDFLKKNKIDPSKIKTIVDFQQVPLTNKDNYFKYYPIEKLVLGGRMDSATVIHYSSGSTGKSLFWPKTKMQNLAGYKGIELLYAQYFDLDKKRTLFFNCYGMGPWTAGEIVHASTKLLSEKGAKVSIISPGTNPKIFYDIFISLADKFEQIVIGGYASFLRDLIQEGVDKGINFKKYNIKLFSGGEKYSENWRDFMTKHLGFKEPYRSVASALGLSEVGVAAISSPFVDYLRMFLHRHGDLALKLFGREDLPSLLQYVPPARYLEIVNENIVVTCIGNIPLVRYDSKDIGSIMTPQEFLGLLPDSFKKEYELLKEPCGIPNLPIIAVHGRADKTIILFGANIYPEQINYITELPQLEKYITGKFIAEKLETISAENYFKLTLELRTGVEATNSIKAIIKSIFVKTLSRINSEYAYTVSNIGDKAKPRIVLKKHGSEGFMSIAGKSAIIKGGSSVIKSVLATPKPPKS